MMQAPLFVLLFILPFTVVQSVDDSQQCVRGAADCEKAWNQATGSVFDSRKRCDSARDYKSCLEKECQRVDVPMSLQIEENLHCNMPRGMTPCEYAQTVCHAAWSREVMTMNTGQERCAVAQEFRACLLDAETELRCRDFGHYDHILQKELQVNCVGADWEDCELQQEQCESEFETANEKASSKLERCFAAIKYRRCLVTVAQTMDCRDTVRFPVALDTTEGIHCSDYTPRPPCKELESKCRSQWTLVSGPTLPIELRCKHAKKWVGCLERIILNRGCPGGYTVAVRAQVEEILSCHIAATFVLDECNEERHRCWTLFEVKRKYEHDKEAMCDNVQDTKACYRKLKKDICSSSEEDAGELAKADEFWCKERNARIRKKKCSEGTASCEKEYSKKSRNSKSRSDLCDAATERNDCYTEVFAKENCDNDEMPEGNIKEYIQYCFASQPAKSPCEKGMDRCKAKFDDEIPSASICQRTGRWRSCLEDLRCVKPYEYPAQLNELEAENKCG